MNEASDYLTKEKRLKLSESLALSRRERRALKFNHHAQVGPRAGGVVTVDRFRKLMK